VALWTFCILSLISKSLQIYIYKMYKNKNWIDQLLYAL
jgi:hypothetical protein